MITRRRAVQLLCSIPVGLYLQSLIGCNQVKDFPIQQSTKVYKSAGEDTRGITRRLLESLGGMESLIGKEDIVILKPNSQWWSQGMTNTDVMAEFITQVLNMPGFGGEIIIADNHQDIELNSRGWTTDKPNGRFNLNDLVQYFNDGGHPNVSKYHWNPAGPNPMPLQLRGSGDSVVKHPSEGDGYIWPQDLYYECPHGNRSVLAYPIFTSTYSGTTIDLKDGAFKDNDYTGQPVKFINFSAINHHGKYTGVTASIKNMMGVVDMSCGFPAPYPKDTFNTHHVGASYLFELLSRRSGQLGKLPFYWDLLLHSSVFRFKYTGGVLGKFMKVIRPVDLHLITAINIGWGSRTNTDMAYPANTILASTDPIALDYTAASQVLLEATRRVSAPEEYVRLNDPGDEDGPFHNFLQECRRELGGTIDPDMIEVIEC